MTVTITTSLIATGAPESVQLVIDGIAAGDAYTVIGVLGDTTWSVPGGVGVGDGGQVVLLDNRTALATPYRYRVLAGGEVTESAPVYVPSAWPVVLQGLDGDVVVAPVTVEAGDFPREPAIRSLTYDVPGRSRPPGRTAPGGDGGGSLSIVTDLAGSAGVRALLRAGRPIVMRCGQRVRDLPLVDLLQLTDVSSQSVGPGTLRRWSLSYLLVDDPQPGTVLAAWSWDDFDAAGLTWDELDALALTWDEFDTYPWTQL